MTQISYSTSGFMDRDVEAALDAVAAAGFTHTEIIAEPPHVAQPLAGPAATDFRQQLERRGLGARTVHAPLRRRILGAPDEPWRRENVAVFSDFLIFCGQIGAGDMVIHPVLNPKFVPDAEEPTIGQRIADAVRRSLDDLVPVAAKSGVRMILENLPYDCAFPLLSMEPLRALVQAYPADQVGLVIDTGHAWTAGLDPAKEILAAGDRLAGTHLQDVPHDAPSDNHWLPTHGELDWDAIRSALAEVNYTGAWTFEVLHGRHDETPEQLARLARQVADDWGLA